MEEQKRENKEELQQETAEEKNSGQGNSSTRSSLLWIFEEAILCIQDIVSAPVS